MKQAKSNTLIIIVHLLHVVISIILATLFDLEVILKTAGIRGTSFLARTTVREFLPGIIHTIYIYVEAINYNNYTIRVVDPDFHKDNCSSIPLIPLTHDHLAKDDRFESEIKSKPIRNNTSWDVKFRNVHQLTETVIFLSCEKPVNNSRRRYNYVDTAPCIKSKRLQYSYVVINGNLSFSDLESSGRIDQITLISTKNGKKLNRNSSTSYRDVHNDLFYGFELSWVQSVRKSWHDYSTCYFDEDSSKVRCLSSCMATLPPTIASCGFRKMILFYIKPYLAKVRLFVEILSTPRIICTIIVIALLMYKWRKRHLSMYDGIEEFLQGHNNLMPVRYSYWDIRKMTKGFSYKLGEGRFGSVYKGKLSNGRLVAVKMLEKSKANGQDFINEVSTIGRIHHVSLYEFIYSININTLATAVP